MGRGAPFDFVGSISVLAGILSWHIEQHRVNLDFTSGI
jgi:hypothetical protein